jgi:hypothetical protein
MEWIHLWYEGCNGGDSLCVCAVTVSDLHICGEGDITSIMVDYDSVIPVIVSLMC